MGGVQLRVGPTGSNTKRTGCSQSCFGYVARKNAMPKLVSLLAFWVEPKGVPATARAMQRVMRTRRGRAARHVADWQPRIMPVLRACLDTRLLSSHPIWWLLEVRLRPTRARLLFVQSFGVRHLELGSVPLDPPMDCFAA